LAACRLSTWRRRSFETGDDRDWVRCDSAVEQRPRLPEGQPDVAGRGGIDTFDVGT
jgi:hypothetical protein